MVWNKNWKWKKEEKTLYRGFWEGSEMIGNKRKERGKEMGSINSMVG